MLSALTFVRGHLLKITAASHIISPRSLVFGISAKVKRWVGNHFEIRAMMRAVIVGAILTSVKVLWKEKCSHLKLLRLSPKNLLDSVTGMIK